VRSFTIITTTPNALCAPVHNRMPVILDPTDYSAWQGEPLADGDALQTLLRPFLAEIMCAAMIAPPSAMSETTIRR
jgi:putative SOS response-associated peptidase YedK